MAVVAAVVAAFLGSECQKFKIISFWENLPIPNRTATSAATSRSRGLVRPTHSNLYIMVCKRVHRSLTPRCYPRTRV